MDRLLEGKGLVRITLDDYARELGAFLAYDEALNVKVLENDSDVERLLREAEEEVRRELTIENLKSNSIIRAYRDFMWKIGIDPTKIRPASEALIRRALRGNLPNINSLVDLGNAISIKYMVPIGIYDLNKIVSDLKLRRAREGEKFEPIGRGEVILKGNELVLADDVGILHLFPYRDSRRTMITLDTRNALVVAAGVPGVDIDRVKGAVHEILKFLEGKGAKVSHDVYLAK
ncbi:hypothetical protein IPA_03860 [Ignicoccus pacificus DSM 13166]|uniref:B3/B4 tRNA-binding domain-containing protein n=1 Tax=Ignicoccus pacificus DSM 13166 TaxID=940294 RepID=A0A977K9C0_9CREN|nr:hypothetical protein IPA_03860 [Ignicoccus pacificus DSM 13166]